MGIPQREIHERLKDSNFDSKRRAETLSLNEWITMARVFEALGQQKQ
jgi:hypothetical protein